MSSEDTFVWAIVNRDTGEAIRHEEIEWSAENLPYLSYPGIKWKRFKLVPAEESDSNE